MNCKLAKNVGLQVPSHDVDIDGVARNGEGDVARHDEHEHPPVGGLSAPAEEGVSAIRVHVHDSQT